MKTEKKRKYSHGKDRKDCKFQIRLSAEDLEELEMASYMDDHNRSEHIRRAIKLYNFLRKHDPAVVDQIGFD